MYPGWVGFPVWDEAGWDEALDAWKGFSVGGLASCHCAVTADCDCAQSMAHTHSSTEREGGR
jgi:hypothetical protein